MSLERIEPKGGMTDLVTVVGGVSFSSVRPGTETVLGLFVCNWNSSDDSSLTGGDKSYRGLFSLGICGMVIGGTEVRGTCFSTSTKVSGTHTV
jgi:hypothetical protein